MPPPTATVLAPALPMASSLEPPLGPYWLGDDTVLSPNVDSERIERFEPGPLMPPLEESRIASDAPLPSSETIPPEPEAAWPGEPDKPSIADMDGYELRLAAVEQQLQTSQAALQAVTVALQISQSDIAHLRREVAFAHDEVQRLEDLLESRHAADLESLEQLSTALDSLIRRTEERQAVREGTNR